LLWNFGVKTTPVARRADLAFVALALLLVAFQAFNCFASEPEAVSSEIMISALVAFSLAALVAAWMGKTRTLKYA